MGSETPTIDELDELSRKATQDYDMEVRIVKCSCGHPSCDRHGLNIGMFPQGAGWDRSYAEFIAALVNYWRSGGAELVRDGLRYRWLRGPELLVSLSFAWEGKVTIPKNVGQDVKEACDAAIDAARKSESGE